MSRQNFQKPSASKGSALLIAIVLLLLAGVMALLAMNVGVFEQRSSGNDLRAKVVHQVAEGGLAQGFEFLYRANPAWLDDTTRWTLCGAAETTFPCGAVPASRRASMYRLNEGTYAVNGLATELTHFMLPLPVSLPATGALDVAYGVAPVLCRVPLPLPTAPAEINCAVGMTNLSDRRVITFVSVSQMRGGDSGRTTLTQTVARSSLLAQGAGVPTIVATGNVTPNGGGDVVAMPDAGGPGLDLSVWSRLSVNTDAGRFGSCKRGEYLASGKISLNDPTWRAQIAASQGNGQGSVQCPAGTVDDWDILDVDSDAGINRDVRASEFPCDLFEYTFNIKAWQDGVSAADDGIAPLTGDNDGFCETRMPTVAFKAPNGTTVQLYPDEAFLYTNAAKIIGGNAALMRTGQSGTQADLKSTSSGLIWCLTDCMQGMNNGTQVGSPTSPVALVLDGVVTLHSEVYGLVFVRDSNATMSPTTGGSASFKFNAGSNVFGSVLIQGVVPTGTGTGTIFGDRELLLSLSTSPALTRFDTLRGGWTDRYSY